MSRLTPSLHPSVRAAIFGLAALIAPAALRAQTTTPPKVFYACYVPSTGTTYRIKEVDLKQVCAKSTHVQYSWTDGNPAAVSKTFTVVSPIQTVVSGQKFFVQPCPAGSQLVGGGHRIVSFGNSEGASTFPLVTRSTPDDDGTGWAVNIMTTFTGNASFTVWARCAQ